MEPVTGTLEDALHAIPPDQLREVVVVEASPEYPGQLIYQPFENPQMFWERYREWLSEFLVLNELFMARAFTEMLEDDGWTVIFAPNTAGILEDYRRWEQPLEVEGLTLKRADGSPSALFDYQNYTINRALERAESKTTDDSLMFYGWGTGTGKTAACSAGVLELFNRRLVDVAFVFTMRTLKLNMLDFFTSSTPLNVVVNDGTAAKRRKRLEDPDVQVFINNPDKARFDEEEIIARVSGKNVVFVFDEAQTLLYGQGKPTLTRLALERIIGACAHAVVWPMSASVVNHDPFRYRDVFQLGRGDRKTNPLGTEAEFQRRYVSNVKNKRFQNRHTRKWFFTTEYTWNEVRLQEVRHRVGHCTQSARKTDPGIKENFKGIQVIDEAVELSTEDRRLISGLYELMEEDPIECENPGPYLMTERYICNAPASLAITDNKVGQELARRYPKLITNAHSSKIEMFCDKVQSIYEADDKVIAFTKWTTMTLFQLSHELDRRNIPHVVHYGVGMTDQQAYEAQQRFRDDPGIPLFLSSDAGAYGLNMQMCRTVINYECPATYDKVMQRNARIDRADSYLDNLTSYIYWTPGTIEEQFHQRMLADRELVEATTGAREVLDYDTEEIENLDWLVSDARK